MDVTITEDTVSARSRKLTEANQILRELDGIYPGYTPPQGKFQIKWSMDLVSLVPEYRVSDYEAWDPQPVMEYRCKCGTDVRVHTPYCDGLAVAKVKLKKVNTCGLEGEFSTYRNCWILCVWAAPPPKEDWTYMMGTDEDYPAEGRYIPVHKGAQCVGLPKNAEPRDLPRAARLMVQMMTENMMTWKQHLAENDAKHKRLMIPIEDRNGNVIRPADPTSPYHQTVDRVKEKLRKFNPDGTIGYTKELDNAGTADVSVSL